MVIGLFAALLGVLFLLLRLRVWLRRSSGKPHGRARAILMDGSNVMHWAGDPRLAVVKRAVDDLLAEGLSPTVYFDANVGYKLYGTFCSAAELARTLRLRRAQVVVAPGGTTADELILERAQRGGLQVVSNDRFRDWAVRYPWVRDHRRFRRGSWREGTLIWAAGRSRAQGKRRRASA